MSDFPKANIRIRVDPANPGQFFACCGLLELASRVSPGAEGWFEEDVFYISSKLDLGGLLTAAKSISLETNANKKSAEADELDEELDEADMDDNGPVIPLHIVSPISLILNWWSEKPLKTWAGSMKERLIFLAMCGAIDSTSADPLNQHQVIYDPIITSFNPNSKTKRKAPKAKKREPFYFDARREANARSLDIGFIPDKLKMETLAYPVVEAMSLVGLQRCRPIPTGTPREFDYFTWSTPFPICVLPAAITGLLVDAKLKRYRFTNAFRSDQRKHKAFQQAKLQPPKP